MTESHQQSFLEKKYQLNSVVSTYFNEIDLEKQQQDLNELHKNLEQQLCYEKNQKQRSFFIKLGLKSIEFKENILREAQHMKVYYLNNANQLEQDLKNQGLNVDQFLLSKKTLETIKQIKFLLSETFASIKNIQLFEKYKIVIALAHIQTIIKKYDPKFLFDDSIEFNKEFIKSLILQNDEQQHEHRTQIYKNQYFQQISKYHSFAQAAYVEGKNKEEQFLQKTNIKKEDFYYAKWSSQPFNPAFMIFKQNNKLILTFRGSQEWSDFLVDSIFSYLNFSIYKSNFNNNYHIKFNYIIDSSRQKIDIPKEILDIDFQDEKNLKNLLLFRKVYEGNAHLGIFKTAISMIKILRKILNSYLELQNLNKLRIVGHSLGAGLTQLIYMLLQFEPLPIQLKKQIEIKAIGFATPLCLSIDFAPLFQNFYNIANQYDIVTRVSQGSLQDLDQQIKIIHEYYHSDPKLFQDILDINNYKNVQQMDLYQEFVLKIFDIYKELKIKSKNDKLSQLGIILQIQSNIFQDHAKFEFFEIEDYQYFNHIMINETLINHPIKFYIENLNNAKIIK